MILSAIRAKSYAADLHKKGCRIVMTNGCFDILHAGHIASLDAAASYGDILIVAVNSDESVQELKGPDRPINALADRMAVLNALRSVNVVVPFWEPTPEALICAVRPDVLVKGGDYTIEEIAGHECVLRAGGSVEIIPLMAGRSSTTTIEKSKGE